MPPPSRPGSTSRLRCSCSTCRRPCLHPLGSRGPRWRPTPNPLPRHPRPAPGGPSTTPSGTRAPGRRTRERNRRRRRTRSGYQLAFNRLDQEIASWAPTLKDEALDCRPPARRQSVGGGPRSVRQVSRSDARDLPRDLPPRPVRATTTPSGETSVSARARRRRPSRRSKRWPCRRRGPSAGSLGNLVLRGSIHLLTCASHAPGLTGAFGESHCCRHSTRELTTNLLIRNETLTKARYRRRQGQHGGKSFDDCDRVEAKPPARCAPSAFLAVRTSLLNYARSREQDRYARNEESQGIRHCQDMRSGVGDGFFDRCIPHPARGGADASG
jgi:hypothetical protein